MSYHIKDNLARVLLKQIGFNILTEAQTMAYLKDYQISTQPGAVVALPEVRDSINPDRVIFKEVNENLRPIHVYKYKSVDKKGSLQPCGALSINKKILNTDFHRVDIIEDFIKKKKRTKTHVDLLIAPWHHYFGRTVNGYYDYMIYMGAKICRLKDALTDNEFNRAVISFALSGTTYERDFLQLLNFDQSRVVDSRTTMITFDECIFGNSQDYTYANKADILSLRKHVLSKAKLNNDERNRIYVSRAGRRRVTNEDALVKMLERYDFKVIEDKSRTILEQVEIFNNASFVLGPHGAGLTNIIWCEPNTHVFEMFHPNFVPGHYRYLSNLMNFQYDAYCHEPVIGTDFKALSEDIQVSVDDIEAYLNKSLKDKEGVVATAA